MPARTVSSDLRCNRHRRLRPLLITLALTILTTILVLIALGATASRDQGFTLGSTTITLEFDENDTQEEFFTHASWDGPTGEFSSGRQFSLGLPSGVLSLRSEYNPVDAIRKRLPDDVPALTKLLDSRNRFEVYCAAEALGLKKKEAISALPRLIVAAEQNGGILESIEYIARAAPKAAVPSLVAGLSSTNFGLLNHCAQLLGDLGTNPLPAAPALLSAFTTNSVRKPDIALAHFRVTGDCSATLPALREILRSVPPNQTMPVLLFLKQVGRHGVAAVPEVLTIVNSSPPRSQFKATALEALASISHDESILLPPLLTTLADTHTNVPPFGSPVRYLRNVAITGLANCGASGLPHLLPLYKSTNNQDKFAAAKALAQIRPSDAAVLDVIKAELLSGHAARVGLACEIVGSLGTNAASILPTLTNLLYVPNIGIRLHAATTFNRLGYCDETIIRTFADALGSSSGGGDAFKIITSIIRTNHEAKATFDQRLAINPKAARNFKMQLNNHRIVARHYGLPDPFSKP